MTTNGASGRIGRWFRADLAGLAAPRVFSQLPDYLDKSE